MTEQPLRPGIAYAEGHKVIDLTDEEAAYILATEPVVAREWRKWVGKSGQAKLPPEQRSGRIILLDAALVRRGLARRAC